MLGDDWPTDPVHAQRFADILQRERISKIHITLEDLKSHHFKIGDLDFTSLLVINLSKADLAIVTVQIDLNHVSTPVVLRLTSPDIDMVEWINTKNVVNFIQDESNETFSRLIELAKTKIQRRFVIKQIAEQGKSVDQVVQDQEEKIIAKTLDIELSNQEQNQKLKRERQLLKFLKDLALSDFYESFIRSIKNEFKIFHQLGEIFLVEIKSDHDLSILNLKVSDRWRDHKCPDGFATPMFDFLNGKNLSAFFANVMQRPFGKVVSLHLKAGFFLIIENHLSDIQNVPFQEFFLDRQEILKMVFDKIDNEETMNSFSFRWEKIFDFIHDPIAVIDEDYTVISYNRAFKRKDEHEKCYQVFAGAAQPCTGCPLKNNAQKSNVQNSTVAASPLLNGNIILAHQNFDVVAFELGDVSGQKSFVHTYKEQTESNKLQSELIQKKKMATIGKLAGHLSHELNNPLTGIRSMAQILLKEAAEGSQVYNDLLEIESAAQRSLSVIRNFIEFSDNKNTQVIVTDIHRLIERTIPLMKTSLRNHVVIKNLHAHAYSARVNAPLFQQVLFNLIKNALQAMSEKGQITIETSSPDGSILKVTVSDSGKGIPLDMQELVFQPFFTTKEKTQGTGLGLSIVKTIVESFHGKIYFTSQEGVGTQFSIELPVVYSDENLSH